MTDQAIEAAAAAVYDVLRARAHRDAASAHMQALVAEMMPAEFEELPADRADHYRSIARAAVQTHQLHCTLHPEETRDGR